MFKLITLAYAHRRNIDGTTDSICKNCFITVIRASREGDLARAEHDHICDRSTLDYWSKMKEVGEGSLLQLHANYDYE